MTGSLGAISVSRSRRKLELPLVKIKPTIRAPNSVLAANVVVLVRIRPDRGVFGGHSPEAGWQAAILFVHCRVGRVKFAAMVPVDPIALVRISVVGFQVEAPLVRDLRHLVVTWPDVAALLVVAPAVALVVFTAVAAPGVRVHKTKAHAALDVRHPDLRVLAAV